MPEVKIPMSGKPEPAITPSTPTSRYSAPEQYDEYPSCLDRDQRRCQCPKCRGDLQAILKVIEREDPEGAAFGI